MGGITRRSAIAAVLRGAAGLAAALVSPGLASGAPGGTPARRGSAPRGRRGRRGPPSGTTWVERRAWHMGTWLRVRLAAPNREAGFAAAGEAFAAVARAEVRWSSWRDDTEMAVLNGAEPGAAVSLDPGVLSVLSELEAWRERTGGAFDPAVGALVDAWDLRGEGRRPTSRELREARRATGMGHLRLDTAAGTAARLREDVWLDAGAFGKGLALGRARDRLRGAGVGSALLDFGGQLTGWGGAPDGEGSWSVGVAHPRDRHAPAASLRLCDASASTTSGSERFVRVDGEDLSHVLDPRSGRPAPTWGSVTVVHPDPMVADLLSTALFVMGPGEGEAWARKHDVAALLLRVDGGEVRRTTTPAMAGRVEALGP